MHFLTIIGFGPRGLYALESFLMALKHTGYEKPPQVLILEQQSQLGVGSAWDCTQPAVNLSNISDRALMDLQARPAITLPDGFMPAFPSFSDWAAQQLNHALSDDTDTFFPRKVIGTYLNERALSLMNALKATDWVKLHPSEAVALEIMNGVCNLTTKDGHVFLSKHTVLTTGHLKTQLSEQDRAFTKHAAASGAHFIRYPYFKESYELLANTHQVAVKGMGLSMIDIVHICVEKQQGGFIKNADSIFLTYTHTGSSGVHVIPFSLDGLPPVPKPIGATVDAAFTPAGAVIDALAQQLIATTAAAHATIDDMLAPICELIATVYGKITGNPSHEQLVALIRSWLKNPDTRDAIILDTSMPILGYMEQTCLMAHGTIAPSLDYTIGQVWRHLQPTMYPIVTHSDLQNDLQSAFIGIDEHTKRYSYGPPVSRVLQLIALAQEGSLNMDYVNDPAIKEIENGWELHQAGKTVVVDTMVNSVLASPNVEIIDDQLINGMYAANYVTSFTGDLGIVTDAYGRVLNNTGTTQNIAVLGRNAKGSVYGVDAILECFSDKVVTWAHKLVEDVDTQD